MAVYDRARKSAANLRKNKRRALSENMASDNNQYPFKDQAFTAKVAEALMLELFADQGPQERSVLHKVSLDVHTQRGGKPATAKSVGSSVIGKALESLKKEGKAHNISTGAWEIRLEGKPSNSGSISQRLAETEAEQPASFAPTFRHTLGPLAAGVDPDNIVYVCAYPSHGEVAWYRGEDQWPCWIASQSRLPVELFQPQARVPEQAAIYLRIHTSSPQMLESTLHGLLFFRESCIGDPNTAPWFLTSPREIAELVTVVDPNAKLENPIADHR